MVMIHDVCVAIDGPAGIGKTTVRKIIAKKLGYVFLDTGIMYRIVAYLCLKKNINYHSEIHSLIKKTIFEIKSNNDIRCNGINIVNDENLNSKNVLNIVSDIAKIKICSYKNS